MADTKHINKVSKLLQKQLLQKFGVTAVAFVVIGSVAYFGTHHNQTSHAASVGVLSVTPASTTAPVGSTVTATVTEDSGTDLVNSVQASLSYDVTKLQYVGLTEGTAFPTVAATSTGTAGLIRVGRATSADNPVSGQNTIVTLTFKVIGSSGITNLTFDPSFSFIVRSTDSANILTDTIGAGFTLKLPTPMATTVSPSNGPLAGGTSITINGTNFVTGAKVSVGATPASDITFVNATTLTAVTPFHAAGAANIVVTNPDGQMATISGGFTYVAPIPVGAAVTPTSGTAVGGTKVIISGTNFVTGPTVMIGGTPATDVTFVSSSQITAVTPAHVSGVVTVVVAFTNGAATSLTGAFTYDTPAPTITSLVPNSGPIAGGTVLTVYGTNLGNTTGVAIGGTAATSLSIGVGTTTSFTVMSPAHAAGAANLVVTTTSGAATKTNAYTYSSLAPTVTASNPSSGTVDGGTKLTITGSNFMSGAKVTLGNMRATNVAVINATTITAVTPAHASGNANLVMTNNDGQSTTASNGFTYLGLGDASGDGRVNAIDLSILITHDNQDYSPADFNGDGVVGSADLAILLGKWTW